MSQHMPALGLLGLDLRLSVFSLTFLTFSILLSDTRILRNIVELQ